MIADQAQGGASGSPRGAYRPLGALRLGLALLVAVQHYQYLLPPPARVPFNVMGFGIIAVAAFFLISGFIVAEACETVYAGRPGAFLLNRMLRLVPPYLASLVLAVAAHEALWRMGVLHVWDWEVTGDPVRWGNVLASVAALVPGGGGGFEFLPFSWSLRVEVAFYLVAFAVCVAPGMLAGCRARMIARCRAGLVHGAWAAWAAVGALLAAMGFVLVHGGPAMVFDGPAFLAGVALHWFTRAPNWRRGVWFSASLALAAAAFTRWPQRFTPAIGAQLAVLAVIVAMIAWLLLRARPGAAMRRLDARLGALSYPLYLNHYVIGIAFTDLVAARGTAVVLAALVSAVALAALMHRIAEAPLDRLRRRIRYSNASMAPSGPRSSIRALASAKPV